MPVVVPVAAGLQIFGVAKETVVGTAVAPTAYPKLTSFKPKEILGTAMDQSIRADMADVHGIQATTTFYQIDFEGGAAPDDLGWFLANLYGAVNVVGASAPYAHTFTLLNTGTGQPTTHTWTHYNGVTTRQYAGCRVQSLTFKYSANELIGYSGTMFALSDATTTVPVPTYTSIVPLAAWPTTVSLSGSTSALVTSLDLTIERSVRPVYTLNNTQNASGLFAAGDFKASGSATLVYNVDTIYANNFKQGVILPIVVDSTTGATTALVEVKHTLTQAFLTDATVADGSDGWMELSASFTGVANSTDGTAAPGQTLLKNGTAAAIYM